LSFSLSCGVGAGVGAGTGFGVTTGRVGAGVFDLVGRDVGSGGSVATAGTDALVDEGAGVRVGAEVGRATGAGVGVLGAGVFALGSALTALTVVEDPAGTDTFTAPTLVSTVPLIVTMVVSPDGETDTYESDPARMTEAMPALRTS
jgi:hypothetical protein